MKFAKYLAAAAALSMAAMPAVATAANPAAGLSVAGHARAASKTDKDSALFGGSVIIEVIAAVAVVVAIVLIADDNDNSRSR